jgi:hypothetical protein
MSSGNVPIFLCKLCNEQREVRLRISDVKRSIRACLCGSRNGMLSETAQRSRSHCELFL